MKTTRQQALLMVDRAMVRIRRSQSRRTLGRFLQQQLDRHFSLADLFVADALQELAEAGEPRPTIGRMAKRLGIEPSRASRMTAAAIRAGLVRRTASQSDGRRSYVELTSEGAKVLEVIRRFRMKFFAHLMLNWSNRECADFGRLLIRFTESLSQGFANEERRELRSNGGRKTKRQ